MTEERTGPIDFPANVSRYGRSEPLPPRYPVRAGPLTAIVEGGDLRYVRLGDDLVVLRLYAAIRDRNWGTIEPHFLAYELDRHDDGFTVRFVAENVSPLVDFEWSGEITGTADGVITATMDGRARKTFLRNRIGWCVLHPMELAGTPATVETPEGTVEGAFPDLISPHQPFLDMQAIRHGTPAGGEITIRFEGDLFEMEDQRNWTDASFKTYSTPLRIPYPAEIREGDRVWQRVTIAATGEAAADAGEAPVRVAVDTSRARPLPPIGLTAAGHGSPLATEDLELLRAVAPAHLHVTLDLTGGGWQERLSRASAEATALGAALEIEAIAGSGGEGLDALAGALTRAGTEVARVLVFPTGEMTTSETVLDAAREAFAAAGIAAQIGGGSRAYFTELNRAELPLAAMDVASYTINPQVHAFDNASLTETLAAQAETVRSARAIVGDRPLVVGPVTLAPPFNPNATGPEPEPSPGELPPSVDERQPSLFAAGWLAGSINALANAGADVLTYFETTGWKGLIERRGHPLRVSAFHSWPGMVFPVYHVLADVAEFRDGEVLSVALSDPLRVQALALRDDGRVRAILANMQDEPAQVSLEIPGMGETRVRRLDEETVDLAAADAAAFRAGGEPLGEGGSSLALELPPFGLLTVDTEVAS
jgi:D-apionolactonase